MRATPASLVGLAFRIRKFEILSLLILTLIVGSIVVVKGGRADRLARDGVTVDARVINVELRVHYRDFFFQGSSGASPSLVISTAICGAPRSQTFQVRILSWNGTRAT
jgi:hypothetical protein